MAKRTSAMTNSELLKLVKNYKGPHTLDDEAYHNEYEQENKIESIHFQSGNFINLKKELSAFDDDNIKLEFKIENKNILLNYINVILNDNEIGVIRLVNSHELMKYSNDNEYFQYSMSDYYYKFDHYYEYFKIDAIYTTPESIHYEIEQNIKEYIHTTKSLFLNKNI